jgi:outer membrane protein assembly factor BamB
MKKQRQKPKNRSNILLQNSTHLNPAGTVLVYVVVLMLIFGILGVVMVSLFSSSIASSITRNDSRRAIHMAESGMRYAFSEIRKADFDPNVMINTLNDTTYRIGGTESFDTNVFSPWFESSALQSLGNDDDLLLNVPIGELPDGYTIPTSGVYAINYEFTGEDLTDVDAVGSSALIKDFGYDKTNPTLTLGDDFNASSGERVSLAVFPKQAQNIDGPGRNLEFTLEAQTIFPKYGGAISIIKDGPNRGGVHEYFYEERVDYPPADNRVVLRNLTAAPGSAGDAYPMPVTTSDWIILSPRNHMVTATGQSDDTTYGGDYTFGRGIFDSSLIWPGSAPPDITADEYTSEIPPRSPYITVNTDADTIDVGSGRAPAGGAEFDTAFYGGDQSIGGDQDYCQQGACLFGPGVRVFFLLDFDSQGDGVTFTLTSFGPELAPHNSETSVGGDIQLSELMGYAGDSRLDPNANPLDDSDFLATNPNDRGLDPPKIAVEFDTRTDNTTLNYCADASNANTRTRNDPLDSEKDAVQYVFWGRASNLIIPCRDNNALYDDNRHDAFGDEPTEEWRFEGASAPYSVWRPAIGPDGSIYVSALDAKLYALNEDGSTKWTFNLTDNNEYMPGVDPDTGTIYSDIFGSSLVAINPNGNEEWRFLISPSSDVGSTPIVDSDGIIYFGTDNAQALIALNPNGTEKWRFDTTFGAVDNAPALNSNESTVYFVATDPDTANNDAMLFAVDTADGSKRWQYPLVAENNELTSSPTVDTKGTADPSDDVIYVGDDDQYVYAFRPAARMLDQDAVTPLPLGAGEWRFRTNGEIESSAAVDPDDGTIYIGSDDGNVWAISPNGNARWRFPTRGNVESSPIVDFDGTIYIGSLDGNVYALKPEARLADPNPTGTGVDELDTTAGEWAFSTDGPVPSSPALGQAGFIHIGSDDTNFYTISQFADPRNFKLLFPDFKPLIPDDKRAFLTYEDLGVNPIDLDDTNDWLNGDFGLKELWAVRLEVDRSLIAVDGKYDYQLSLWIRQCQVLDCSDITGTFFSDTRIDYKNAPAALPDLPMIQRFRLSAAEQAEFERFYFGFTGATGVGQTQSAIISQFNLSFIRPGDPDVDVAAGDDLGWGP